MTTASAAVPASVSPLSFLSGLALFVLAVAVLAVAVGAVRFFRSGGHRAGMARLAAFDATSPEARRRARRNARTVVDLDDAGTVRAVTVEPRR